MNKEICFSNETGVGFKDYMHEYLSTTMKKSGYTYSTTKTFAEKEALLNKSILKDIEELAGVKFAQEGIAPEVMMEHPNIRFATMAVVGQLIDTILPEVIDKSIGLYTDTRYGNFGDSFRFDVEPNDLFFVSKVGRNQRTVDFQRQYAGTQYVTPENHAISVYVNIFRALCGLDSMANFVMKAILSIEANMNKEIFQALNTAMGALPSTPTDGALQITAAGGVVEKTAAIKLAQTVSAFNGGAPAMFIGTKLALSHIFPSADSGFRYESPEVTYFRNVWGIDTLELAQIADYEDKYKLALDDKKVFVLSPSSQKIIKLCYEGATIAKILENNQTANGIEATTLNKSYGIAVATNAVAGVINLGD